MSQPGAADILVAARRALLDAMDALAERRPALVLVGAQAIYLHTGNAPVALAESTKDSDLAINPLQLRDDPLLEEAMQRAGSTQDASVSQPGSWLSSDGVPVDLMVPEQLAGAGSRRGGRVAPHSDHATRRATGLEAAVSDHAPMLVNALDPNDARAIEMNVAGPAALLVAKLHKLGERADTPKTTRQRCTRRVPLACRDRERAHGGDPPPAPGARAVRSSHARRVSLLGAVVRGGTGSAGLDNGGPRRAAPWRSGDRKRLRFRARSGPPRTPVT